MIKTVFLFSFLFAYNISFSQKSKKERSDEIYKQIMVGNKKEISKNENQYKNDSIVCESDIEPIKFNRKALSKPQPKIICNESGIVVVEIKVNRLGKVIDAIAGVNGTTNTAKCLLDEAKKAAINTKWESNEDAPEIEIGKITYNFILN